MAYSPQGTREGRLDHVNLASLVDYQVAEHYWDRWGMLFSGMATCSTA